MSSSIGVMYCVNISMYWGRFLDKILRPYDVASLKTNGLHSQVELNIKTSAAFIKVDTSSLSPQIVTFDGKSFITGSQYCLKFEAWFPIKWNWRPGWDFSRSLAISTPSTWFLPEVQRPTLMMWVLSKDNPNSFWANSCSFLVLNLFSIGNSNTSPYEGTFANVFSLWNGVQKAYASGWYNLLASGSNQTLWQVSTILHVLSLA